MEEKAFAPAPNPTKVATKWALINTLTGIVLTYAFEFMDLDDKSPVKYIAYIPFIVFLFLSQKEFRDELGGYISFNTAFSTGFRYSLFTGILSAIFLCLYLMVLSPDVFDKSMEAQRVVMEEKGMSSGDIDKAMGIAKSWGPIMGAFVMALFSTIIGAILALIGAAIFKKERSPFDIVEDATDPTE